MGVLGNLQREKFCQELHKRMWSGERTTLAAVAAYREHICSGADPKYVNELALELFRSEDVQKRLQEFTDYAAKLCGMDWSRDKLDILKRIEDYFDAT